jgi:hypothetical protein
MHRASLGERKNRSPLTQRTTNTNAEFVRRHGFVLVLRLGMCARHVLRTRVGQGSLGVSGRLPKEEIEALCGGAGQSVRFPPGSSGSGPRL